MLAQALVTRLLNEAVFDVTSDQALAWLDSRHKTMIARAKSLRKSIAVATLVDDTAFYELPDEALEIYELAVNGSPYTRARRPDVYGYSQSTLVWTGPGGLIVLDSDTSGNEGIQIMPTPSGGELLTAYAACRAPDLALADSILVPDEYADALYEGMVATGLATDSEQLGAADRFEARFDAKCEELRRDVRRRLKTGPVQIRLQGVNA